MAELPNLSDASLTAEALRQALALQPHPEGGFYREVWRDTPSHGGRGTGSAILFLLTAGQKSRWHRVDAAEIWLWHAGSSLRLGISDAQGRRRLRLGPELGQGESLQIAVPAYAWQEAESLGAWTLVGCVVAPAFEFRGFEMAPSDSDEPPG
jgi:predicted cupin superfamily sugar epimerase